MTSATAPAGVADTAAVRVGDPIRIECPDPIGFFDAERRLWDTAQLWWPAGGTALLTFGTAVTISGAGSVWSRDDSGRPMAWSGADRFTAVQDLIDDIRLRSRGTSAPVFHGGFAFTRGSGRSLEWQRFGPVHWWLPRWTLSHDGADHAAARINSVDRGMRGRPVRVPRGDAGPPGERKTAPSAGETRRIPDRDSWTQAAERIVERIRAGELRKAVLARSEHLHLGRPADIATILRSLRHLDPNACLFAIAQGPDVFVGASPELLLTSDGEHVRTEPLAGTAPAGRPARDVLRDVKLVEEHELVVSGLMRRLGTVCRESGRTERTRLVTRGPVVHLASTVRGHLDASSGFCDALGAIHPTAAVGTLPWQPDVIAAAEDFDRGWYSAPIGWTDGHTGTAMLALRCGLITRDRAVLYAGAGLVAGSDPDAEWTETDWKLDVMRSALGIARSAAAGT